MRPKSVVYNHFREVSENDKVLFLCLYCDIKYVTKNATKFTKHLIKCKKCPLQVKDSFKNQNVSFVEETANTSVATTSSSSSIQIENSNDIVHTEIHKIVSRAIYVTGQPLSILEHPLWKEVFHVLKPDYNPPSRRAISTNLLDDEYTAISSKVKEHVQCAQTLHLAIDGWSNIRNESILNVMIYTPKPYFYKFIEAKENRHTAEYLTEEISCLLDTLGAAKFMGVVTDNAANMVKCGRLLTNQYPNVVWVGCIAHTLNLLIEDLLKLDTIKEVLTFVVSIVKCTSYSQILTAEFRKLASENEVTVSLILPVKTRWGSYYKCLENFIKCKVILQLMAINTVTSNLIQFKTKLLDESFWDCVNKHAKIFKPIVDWIVKIEGDYNSIHLVHQAFIDITNTLTSRRAKEAFGRDEVKIVEEKFLARKSHALKPIHYAATVLDPTNQGANLEHSENLDGCQFILDHSQCDGSLGENIFQELSHYKSRSDEYERCFIWSSPSAIKLKPLEWWQLFFPKTYLGKTAIKILSVPSTSASVERSFSTFANIHTKNRNRLATERAGKLCFIAHNWKLLHPQGSRSSKNDEAGHPSEDEEEQIEWDFIDIAAARTAQEENIIIVGSEEEEQNDPLLN